MIDLKERFKRLDRIPSPNLWVTIQVRAAQPVDRRRFERLRRRVSFRRLVSAAAAVAVLTALLLFVLPLTLVERRPAFAIVQDAIKAVQALPPFSASVSYTRPGGRGTYLILYRSHAVWRVEVIDRTRDLGAPGNFAEELTFRFPNAGFIGPGDYIVSDGERVGMFQAGRKYFFSMPLELEERSPLGQLAWDDPFAGSEREILPRPVRDPSAALTTWKRRCSDSKTFADETVAGRQAHHVRCGEWELWIDAATGLVLKVETTQYVLSVEEIEYSATFDPGAFEVKLPEGACDRGSGGAFPGDPETCLKVGEFAPTWSGRLLGGGQFDLGSPRGRPVIVFFWSDFFQPGDLPLEALKDFNVAFERWRARATWVSVDTGTEVTERTARRVVDGQNYTFPVVLDDPDPKAVRETGKIVTLWDMGVPAWVALDKEGRVVGIAFGRLTAEQIDALLSKAGG